MGCDWVPSSAEEVGQLFTSGDWTEFPDPPLTEEEVNQLHGTMVEILVDTTSKDAVTVAAMLADQQYDTELLVHQGTRRVALMVNFPNGYTRWWLINCWTPMEREVLHRTVAPEKKLLSQVSLALPIAVGVGLVALVLATVWATGGKK